MTARAVDQLVETLRANGKDVNPEKGKIDGYWGQCPVPTHGRGRGDLHPSLHITGVEGRILIHCILRCARADVLAAIGWTEADLFDQKTTIYCYDDGRKVKRWYDNGKRQFAQSDHKDKKPTLYRLAKVKQAVADRRVVWFPEGESDVHAIESLGDEVATTSPMGADNVDKCDLSPLYGGQIIVLLDDDAKGETRAIKLQRLLRGRVRSLDFMKSAVGNDVSDHIAAGLTLDQLMPWWPPPADQEPEPEDETNAAEPESDIGFIPGGTFILDTDPTPRVIWGEGDQVGWAEGESLIIAGAQGLGKTTIVQQLVLGWIGIEGFECLFGFPIKRGKRVLYLAMDRPRQIARSFRRMVHTDLRAALDDRLLIWRGSSAMRPVPAPLVARSPVTHGEPIE